MGMISASNPDNSRIASDASMPSKRSRSRLCVLAFQQTYRTILLKSLYGIIENKQEINVTQGGMFLAFDTHVIEF